MNISSLSIKRPVATIMLMMMVVVLGVSAFLGMPRDLMPKIEYPMALVICDYPNAAPQEVESMVTKPLETALASVEGLDSMYSITLQGQSVVAVQFDMDQDMNFATLNMREKIALVEDYLPSTAGQPMVMKVDMNSLPISQVYVSGDIPLDELNNILENNIVSKFERLSGVASVSITGAIEEQVSITVDQQKLADYGLNLALLSQLLAAENINMPSGDISKGSTEIIVRTVGEFKSVDDMRNVPLVLPDYSVVRLSDIATIQEGYKEQDSISRIDGNTAIGLMITKQSDANTVNVSNEVEDLLKDLRNDYPDLNFVVGFDQADFIKGSLSSAGEAAIIGALLSVVVVFLFLLNMRSTLVIALSIPTSLLATFALMNWLGISLNVVTLCSLTISIGMLVDDSIVVLENIFRIRQNIPSPQEASAQGSREVLLAVTASTLTTILVFLPIAVSGGLAGLMFKDFCITIVIALIASLLVSVTIVPMLCSKLLTRGISMDYIRFGTKRYKFRYIQRFSAAIETLTGWYEKVVSSALNKRKKVVITCLLIFSASLGLVLVVGTELLPAADEGTFTVAVETPYGTSLEEKNDVVSGIEAYILSLPETEHCTVDISGSGKTNAMSFSVDESDTLSVTLVDKTERKRSTDEVASDVSKQFADATGAKIEVSVTSTYSDMMSGGSDLSLIIKGNDLDTLESIGNDLTSSIKNTKGVADAYLDLKEGTPEVKVSLDRNAAAYYGVTAYNLANGLSSALSGTTATTLKVDGKETDIILSLPDTYTESLENMKQVMITGNSGLKVPVGQIATFEYDNSPNVINRLDQQRYVTLYVDIEGNDLGGVSDDIHKIVNNYQFPDGYFTETGGGEAEMRDAFVQLSKALVIAILLVYLILAAQFESLILPFVIAMAIPFAMSGAFLALFLTGSALSLVSFLGLILLVGIVVKNSILLVDFVNRNREEMSRDKALVEAGKVRLRPIIMTSLTTIVGMVPMSLGYGEGAETMAPMAIAIIGGLITSTIVTLVFTPVLYSVVDDRKTLRQQKRREKDSLIDNLEAEWAMEDMKNGKNEA